MDAGSGGPKLPLGPAVMVLGPSRWRSQDQGHDVLDASPLDVRRRIVAKVRELGVNGVLLEDAAEEVPMDNFESFLRTVAGHHVQTFILFWPIGARLHGLDVELGYLLTRMSEGTLAPEDVGLLAQQHRFEEDTLDEVIAYSEPGNRTRYHDDLMARGCPVYRWSNAGQLWRQVRAMAEDHRWRHAGSGP